MFQLIEVSVRGEGELRPLTGLGSPMDALQRFCEVPSPLRLTPGEVVLHAADASWLAVDDFGKARARCSLWWQRTPPMPGERLGLIGHYAAENDDAARPLLHQALGVLAAHGCTFAVAPMDGSTWRRYRFITQRGPEPTFFMEPDNADDWPGHFTGLGFTPLARYHSALNDDLARAEPRSADAARRLHDDGVRIRPLNMDRFEDELRAIGSLSLVSFCDNFLYTPISEEDFLSQYRPLRSFVQPELVLLAEQQGRLIGFVFAVPDLHQAMSGRRADTVLVKTVAVHPDHAGAGLGGLLIARCQQAAHELGCKKAIHALFHEANRSGRISAHSARVMRTYTLFGKKLGREGG